jgi:DNA invertase Pin-like site-specific DNA recombinase
MAAPGLGSVPAAAPAAVVPPPVGNRLRAIGYRRVSTDDQVKGYSLEHQATVIRRWCTEKDVELVALFDNDDRGESGKSLARAGLDRVRDRLAHGDIDYVVVTKIDRLGRSLQDNARLFDEWTATGVQIVAVENGCVIDAQSSRMFPHMLSWLGDFERRQILSRSLPGMGARVAHGLPLGRIPFGYQLTTPAGADAEEVALDPVRAPMVLALFQQAAAASCGCSALATWAQRQFPAESWSAQRVRRILVNRVYLGELHTTLQGVATVRIGNHPAVVPAGLFDQIQDGLARRRAESDQGHRDSGVSSLLGGIATCGRCGESLTWRRNPRTGQGAYWCSGRASGGTGCPLAPLPVDVEVFVLRAVFDQVERWSGQIRAAWPTTVEGIAAFLDEERRRCRVVVERFAAEQARLGGLLGSGALDGGRYAEAFLALKQETEAARRLMKVQDGKAYLASLVARDGGGTIYWHPIDGAFMALDITQRRRFLRAFCQSIVLSDVIPEGGMPAPAIAFQESAADALAILGNGFSFMLSRSPGIDVARSLREMGWTRREGRQGFGVWVDPAGVQEVRVLEGMG